MQHKKSSTIFGHYSVVAFAAGGVHSAGTVVKKTVTDTLNPILPKLCLSTLIRRCDHATAYTRVFSFPSVGLRVSGAGGVVRAV